MGKKKAPVTLEINLCTELSAHVQFLSKLQKVEFEEAVTMLIKEDKQAWDDQKKIWKEDSKHARS
jgi:hypothetical protein